jgi:hypothetical protein
VRWLESTGSKSRASPRGPSPLSCISVNPRAQSRKQRQKIQDPVCRLGGLVRCPLVRPLSGALFRGLCAVRQPPGDPNRQARLSLAQREPARSTGGDRPSGTDMKRVAAARTTGWHCNPYQVPLTTPAAAALPPPPTHTHTRAPEPMARGTGLERKDGPAQRRRRRSTRAVRK